MQIVDFSVEYMAAAQLLVMENYQEEREHVTCLPEVRKLPSLQELAQNGLGVAAVEDCGECLRIFPAQCGKMLIWGIYKKIVLRCPIFYDLPSILGVLGHIWKNLFPVPHLPQKKGI